jgi:hypothetical protein
MITEPFIAISSLDAVVEDVLATTDFIDIHTHLFSPSLGSLGLWGIDELLTYHYLEAELFRFSPITPEQYWGLTKTQRADLVWKTLFVDNSPLSEAARGVVAVLSALKLDTSARTLEPLRAYFRSQKIAEYIPHVFRLAGISHAVMTNDPLDPEEVALWMRGVEPDSRFPAVIRIDRILNHWSAHYSALAAQGYAVDFNGGGSSMKEVRRFLAEWVARMKPVYMAVSLEDTFLFPVDDVRTRLFREAVLPTCREFHLPMSLMIGVRRQINPALRLAGDGAGRADMRAVQNLALEFPDNRFLISMLSRENQHELCVIARKFRNLLPFGCWWFLNNASIVEEMTRERLEMLGTSFIPQHSDARILEQVIYKWRNTRRTVGAILSQSYKLLSADGRSVTRDDIQRDVNRLFRTNFENWIQRAG